MTVEINVWFPTVKGDIGHASMMVDGGDPPGAMYLSRWPGSLAAALVAGKGANNRFDDDVSAEGGRQPSKIRLTKLDETAIKKAMKKYLTDDLYSFLLLNCAQQVDQCLTKGLPTAGIIISALTAPATAANTPWTLYVKAKELSVLYG